MQPSSAKSIYYVYYFMATISVMLPIVPFTQVSGFMNDMAPGGDKATLTLANGHNIPTTPLAGRFQVILPDGSKVWLNNASLLRYPTIFTGKDREVELTGEAYFEVDIAWKNGLFHFHDADIKAVMRMLARWYDVDFAYGAVVPLPLYPYIICATRLPRYIA